MNVHGKGDAAAQDQPDQPGHGTAPEDPESFLSEHPAGANESITILGPGLDALHPRLDRVERLSDVDGHQARGGSEPKRRQCPQPLARRHVRLGELAEHGVGPEAGG